MIQLGKLIEVESKGRQSSARIKKIKKNIANSISILLKIIIK